MVYVLLRLSSVYSNRKNAGRPPQFGCSTIALDHCFSPPSQIMVSTGTIASSQIALSAMVIARGFGKKSTDWTEQKDRKREIKKMIGSQILPYEFFWQHIIDHVACHSWVLIIYLHNCASCTHYYVHYHIHIKDTT